MGEINTLGVAAGKDGLAKIMKLVIAMVFTVTVALLNITAKPQPQPVAVHLGETVSALSVTKSNPATDTPAATETPQPTKPAFNASDPSTLPTCAAGEIVRADNGQCSAAAQPAPVTAAAPTQAAPVSSNEAKAFIYQHESGNRTDAINAGSGACGLGQALPCSKLPCSLQDYACQDAWFTQYMVSRYGTWENARAFWLANRWW